MRIKLTRGYVRVPDAWKVEDEETVQTKVWHYLFEKKTKVRGLGEGELAHPLRNAYKRAFKDVGLDTSVPKLTVLSNFGHCSFTNGDKPFTRREYFQAYLERQNEDWFSELSDNIAFDRPRGDQASKVTGACQPSKPVIFAVQNWDEPTFKLKTKSDQQDLWQQNPEFNWTRAFRDRFADAYFFLCQASIDQRNHGELWRNFSIDAVLLLHAVSLICACFSSNEHTQQKQKLFSCATALLSGFILQ